jgi:glycerol-3-phosphate responsive antiterminator
LVSIYLIGAGVPGDINKAIELFEKVLNLETQVLFIISEMCMKIEMELKKISAKYLIIIHMEFFLKMLNHSTNSVSSF